MDPLFLDGVDGTDVLIVALKVAVAFALLLLAVMLMVWFERKLIGDMQNRIGPNLAGPWGILQTLADGLKLFFKEDLIPDRAERRVFVLAPLLALVPAFLLFAIVPVGGNFNDGGGGIVEILGRKTLLQVADPPIGVLFALAMSSIAVYGVMLAGWSSGSKYPLLGSVRASAQMVSYEAALGLSVAAVVLVAGTLSTNGIVSEQAGEGFFGVVPRWNLIVAGVVPFVIFLIAGTAELNRPPFDLVEAEQELVGGFHTEYSSIRFAFFFLAEFMNAVTMSAIIVTLFLGGPAGPDLGGPGWASDYVWPVMWFMGKLFCFLFTFVWFRATLPRVRYDQLMDLGWKVLIPTAIGWFLLLGAIRVGDDRDWNGVAVVAASFAVFMVAGTLLSSAVRRARPRSPRRDRGVRLMGYLTGFKVTLGKIFESRLTTEYPEEKSPKPLRQHGRHVLNRYEDGMEKCIGCELCAGVCPARCIYVRGADNPVDDPVSPGERYGYVYEINYLRCIHCDLCVEACPTEAITESKLFEFSFTSRRDAVYTKEELVVDDDGSPRQLPWEDWRPGEDQDTSAWMRATAPSGSAAHTGRVGWSGELGHGVRAPEQGQSQEVEAPPDAASTESRPDEVDR